MTTRYGLVLRKHRTTTEARCCRWVGALEIGTRRVAAAGHMLETKAWAHRSYRRSQEPDHCGNEIDEAFEVNGSAVIACGEVAEGHHNVEHAGSHSMPDSMINNYNSKP